MRKVKYLIIGSGPTGLGAALRLKESGEDNFFILETNSWVGGLAASFKDQAGFTWDIGGHVQFSHYSYFDEVMDRAIDPQHWLTHQRESWVWIQNGFVPYPFQNNIHYLPKEAQWECLKGILDISLAADKQLPANFEEWILSIFGQGVADHFMLPYNYKVWAYPPAELAYHWIGERVAVTDLKRVLENMVHQKLDASWGPNNMFRFPANGGTGAIWNSVAQMIGMHKIQLNAEVALVNSDSRKITLQSGEVIEYEFLLTTMPVDILCRKTKGIGGKTVKSAQYLKHSSSNIVGVGLRGKASEQLEPKCWMYFPESNCPFYRVTLFSKYAPSNVPDISSQFSLMTETSESPKKPVSASTLIDETIYGLQQTKLISDSDEIVSVWSYRAEYGYPTPSLERDSILDEVIPALESRDIYSRGRFGAWKYEVSNQDHSFMQGVEWVDMMTNGIAEQTLKINRINKSNSSPYYSEELVYSST